MHHSGCGDHSYMETGRMWEISVPSSWFICEYKIPLKIVFFNKIHIK